MTQKLRDKMYFLAGLRGICSTGSGMMHGWFMEDACGAHGGCMSGSWRVHGECMGAHGRCMRGA